VGGYSYPSPQDGMYVPFLFSELFMLTFVGLSSLIKENIEGGA
jgi:hypothetical protein